MSDTGGSTTNSDFFVTTPPGPGASGVLVGKRIGGYRMDAVMGEGACAYVYKGVQIALGRSVALKILKAEFACDALRISDFLEGARRAASLIHPNIVQVYDVVSMGDLHFIVMELVEAQTMDVWLADGRSLPIGDALHLAKSICEALSAAQRLHIAHGNICPANIFMGPDERVRLSDFGLHAFLPSRAPQTDEEIWRASYIAPEQLAGETENEKADVYSLGVVLYQTVVGSLPYSPVGLGQRLRGGEVQVEIVDAHTKHPGIPSAFSELLAGMLASDPASRPDIGQVLRVVRMIIGKLGDKASTKILRELDRRGLQLPPVSRRRYRRLRSNLEVNLVPRKTSDKSAIILLSKIRNLGENGAYVTSMEPLPVGTFVNLEFNLEGRKTRVHVLGIVRWVDKNEGNSGMGIQFLEVSTTDRNSIRDYVDSRLADEMAKVLTRTHMHKAILRILLCSWGQSLSFDRMVSITGASRSLLQRTLADFQKYNLLRIQDSTIVCAEPAAPETVDALSKALRGA